MFEKPICRTVPVLLDLSLVAAPAAQRRVRRQAPKAAAASTGAPACRSFTNMGHTVASGADGPL